MDDANQLSGRLGALRNRMELACAGCGREPGSVRLLPVTKGFPSDTVVQAMRLGLMEFGENRVQEAEAKIAAVEPRPRWHLVGHLQSNKAKRAVQLFDVIQSLDSAAIADEVTKRAAQTGRSVTGFVEVNTSRDRTKYGVDPAEAMKLLEHTRGLNGIDLRGLMTIGPLQGGPAGARTSFRALAAIREEAARAGLLPPDAELSMGMSDDFEIAIEEGATIIRIGTALFGPRRAGVAA